METFIFYIWRYFLFKVGGVVWLVCLSGLLSLLGEDVTGLCVNDSDCGTVGFGPDGKHWYKI